MKKKLIPKQQLLKQQVPKPSLVPSSIYSKHNLTYLIISAKPNSKISQIVSIDEESIGVSIAAPPKDGEANQELIKFMSGLLGVKKSMVELEKGAKSRHKVIIVENMTIEEVYQRVKEELE